MSEPTRTRIPLALIEVCCAVCGTEAKAIEVNRDKVRFHLENGSMVRFPARGLTEPEIAELKAMFLRCECCQDDHEESQSRC